MLRKYTVDTYSEYLRMGSSHNCTTLLHWSIVIDQLGSGRLSSLGDRGWSDGHSGARP